MQGNKLHGVVADISCSVSNAVTSVQLKKSKFASQLLPAYLTAVLLSTAFMKTKPTFPYEFPQVACCLKPQHPKGF